MTMTDIIRLARPYLVLLALFTVGRLVMGARGVPYEKGHHVFSIVILTFMASAFYGMFCRRWRGYRWLDALALGAALGFTAEFLIFVATAASYALGLQTYFNHPTALNVPAPIPFEQALVARAGGLFFGTIANAIAGLLGWLLGALLPPAAVPTTIR
jgi:hypothetical protein